ncbi:hypothetical protein WKV44_07905 [Spirochaetia bacterium 38H-sp]|uniref:Integron gene cassette protein n=1 Tax=Rarispira pelagica TaxID=3141764 RepID=A0ABU9UE97_9SPIR
MLREIKNVKQNPGEYRRWFSDDYFDLIVWYAEDKKTITGFQLCYDKPGKERAFTWKSPDSYLHTAVDAGEEPLSAKMSPILVADGSFDMLDVLQRFNKAGKALEPVIFNIVIEKIKTCPANLM